MNRQFIKQKYNSKIKLIFAVVCMIIVAVTVSGCGNSENDNTNATQDTAVTYKVNSGEFDWTGNEYTSAFPKPKEWNISQYLIDDNQKLCSVIVDNADLESTKQYVKSLEKSGVTTVKYQIDDDTEYPILNYLGESNGYNISISQSDDTATVSITKAE